MPVRDSRPGLPAIPAAEAALPRPRSGAPELPSRGRPRSIRSVALILGGLGMLAAACGGKSPTDPSAKVAKVTVTPATAALAPQETRQLNATVTNGDGEVLQGQMVTWTSLDEAVASVGSGGLVTARQPGTASIQAAAGGKTATASITVTEAGILGQLSIPSGVALDPTGLRMVSSAGEGHVDASGAFHLEVLPGPGAQVDLMTASGQLVMIGLVNSAGTGIDVSVTTTAQVLIYYALGAFGLPDDNQDTAMSLIAQHPAVATLAALLADRMRVNPLVVAVGDAQLAAAIQQARDDVLGAVQAGIVEGPSMSAASRASMPLLSLSIEQKGTQSGVELLHNMAGDGIVAQNHFRRPAAVLVYRTAIEDAQGQVTPEPTPVLVAGPVDVPPTGRLGLLTAIGDVLTGNAPFAPVQSASIPIPPVYGANKTFLEAVLLGPSFDFVSPVPIMQDSRFYGFAGEWNSIIDTKQRELFWNGFAAGALETLAFGKVGAIPAANRQGFVDGISAIANPRLQGLGILLRADGGYAQALTLVLDELLAGSYPLDFIAVAKDALPVGIAQQAKAAQIEARLAARASAAAIIVAVQVALSAPDVAAVIYHLQNSAPGESWKLTVTEPHITVTPNPGQITANQRSIIFTASVDGFPNDEFIFTWHSTRQNGDVSVNDPSGSTRGPTGQAQYIATTPQLPLGPLDVVTVDVKRVIPVTGGRENVGQAEVTVNGPAYYYNVSLSPSSVSIPGSGTTNLTTVITPAYQGAGLFFRWSNTGHFGTIFPAPGTLTGTQTATYSALPGTDGTDTVRVDVFGDTGDSLGTATALVTVEPRQPITISGSWQYHQEFFSDAAGNPRVCIAAYITFPLVTDGMHYAMWAHGFFDSAFWGASITRTFGPPPFPAQSPSCGVNLGADGANYNFFLTGGTGPASGAGSQVSAVQSRFAGMIVDVTVSF